MDFEKKVAEMTSSLFTDGWVEEQVHDAIKAAIKKAIDDQFSWNGVGYKKIKQVVEESVEKSVSCFVPEYIPKLEIVLTEIMEQSVIAEKKHLLDNFRTLMTDTNIPGRVEHGHRLITLDEIFGFYCKYVARYFDTEDRKVDTDDYPTYESVNCKAWIKADDPRKEYFRSRYKHATLYLITEDGEDEHGQSCNFKIPLITWDEDEKNWSIYDIPEPIDFGQLAYADTMLVYMYQLKNNFVKIVATRKEFDEYVELDNKPECNWS